MQAMYVNHRVDSTAEAERIFAALAHGGEVQMPLAETFFAARFGSLVDRFGTPWMINREQADSLA
jgi:PhnB protein